MKKTLFCILAVDGVSADYLFSRLPRLALLLVMLSLTGSLSLVSLDPGFGLECVLIYDSSLTCMLGLWMSFIPIAFSLKARPAMPVVTRSLASCVVR